MAYLYKRKSGRVEIREARSTPSGPRSRTLVSFRGALRPEHLDRAESSAAGSLDREAMCRRANELGIPVVAATADAAARELIAQLRTGATLDPRLAGLLRERLDAIASEPVQDELADVVEWLGAGDHERGRALRDVMRLYDTIARSREPVPEAHAPSFPRFSVRPERQAS